MEEQKTEETGFYQNLIVFTEKYKKQLIIAGALVIVIAAGVVMYSKLVLEPKKAESQEILAKVQEYFKLDSFNLVVNGGVGLKSAVQISKEYSSTDAGNLSNYYAGVSYLKLGEYDNAIKYLKKFKSHGDFLIGSIASACIGDAYVEKGDFDEALKYYTKAVEYNPNELTTPIHTRKALNIMIEKQKYDQGIKMIEKLLKVEDLPDNFKFELKKYKGLFEAKSGKLNPDGNA